MITEYCKLKVEKTFTLDFQTDVFLRFALDEILPFVVIDEYFVRFQLAP